ncbi:MAG: hypothetical protein R3E89_11655 [Thiolinea sp.]
MNKQQDFDATIRIPVITDLVRSGDPEIIKRSKSGASTEYQQHFERRLQERIAELSSATGQDEYAGLARAHAIRSEQQDDEEQSGFALDTDFEQQIDRHRHELLRELSTMLK